MKPGMLRDRKIIDKRLSDARGKLRFKRTTDVVAGKANLDNLDRLQNRGRIKRLLNSYMQSQERSAEAGLLSLQNSSSQAVIPALPADAGDSVFLTTAPPDPGEPMPSDKRCFVAFSEERDHLGRLIDSVSLFLNQLF